MNSIIIGGSRFAVGREGETPARVLTWHEHGIQFRAGEGYNKRRREEINLCVWHWTGGENEPDAMAAQLKKRLLGVEFAISRAGVIYQFCDPILVDTADAAGVNPRSVGCEIVNYGIKSWDRAWIAPRLGRDRPVVETIVHDRKLMVADFYPHQIRAAQQLAAALSRALPIPAEVPTNGDPGWVINHALPAAELALFKGHVGHYHVTEAKFDPGPQLMRELMAMLWRDHRIPNV